MNSYLNEDFNYLCFPGIGGSSEKHWQSVWARRNRDIIMVRQRNWTSPNKNAWVQGLSEAIDDASDKPIIIIAHSLACITVMFAQAENKLENVAGVFMVAPADSERALFPKHCKGFTPIPRGRLSMPSIILGSENDEWCSIEKAQKLANACGSKFVNLGKKGHVTSEDGFGEWEIGFNLLRDFTELCK